MILPKKINILRIKMNFITYISDFEQIKICKLLNVNEIIFQAYKYSSKITNPENTIDKIFDILSKDEFKEPTKEMKLWFEVDILAFDKDFTGIEELLNNLVKNGFYGVKIQDIGIYYLIFEKKIPLKISLDTTTGGNNFEFYNFFAKYNEIERIVLSRELNIEKIKYYASKINKLEIQIYGKIQIFHTRRYVISSLANQNLIEKSDTYQIKEETRENEIFDILESPDGTFMFYSKLMNLFNYIKTFDLLNIKMLIDLRHITDLNSFKKILNKFVNQTNDDLFIIENKEFIENIDKKEDVYIPDVNFAKTEDGIVLDAVKEAVIVLKTKKTLKTNDELLFIGEKNREIKYIITEMDNFSEGIYIIPWRKYINTNSTFTISEK